MRIIALLNRIAPEVTGEDLEAELAEAVASIAQRAADRDSVVESRLRNLEAEKAALERVLAKTA